VRLPFVISIPHCSSRIPNAIKPDIALSRDAVNDSVDWGTREIFGSLNAAAILCADWSRLVVDLNRDPGRRDAKGVIAAVDYHGRPVYRQGMTPERVEIDDLLARYYWPYHIRLRAALIKRDIKGLFDGHSLNGIGPSEAPDAGKRRRDIVLSNNGDHRGEAAASLGSTTCDIETFHLMKQVFEAAGFSVALNDPYTAGFITTHYGRTLTEMGKFAVQIEINQDLFVHPETLQLVPERLAAIRERIRRCFDDIARIL